MIELKEIRKQYNISGRMNEALKGVTLKVDRGEFVAITGPSGCGKSTLLNLIGLLDIHTSGLYLFEGQDTGNLSEKARTRFRKNNIGFVFQNFNLIEELTVYENIEFPLLYHKVRPDKRRKKVQELMQYFEISDKKEMYSWQLSGGEQQRVAIARSVVTDPAILLADEPTGNLDPQNGMEVMKLLASLNENGTTIIMVTHSTEFSSLAGRNIRMAGGKIQNGQSAGNN